MRSAKRCLFVVSVSLAIASTIVPLAAPSQVLNRTQIWNRACPPPANSGPTLFATNGQPREVRIPNYGSEPAESVVTALRSLGLVPTSSTESSTLPSGTFVRTVPSGGTCVDRGSSVTVVSSSGESVPPRMPGSGWIPPRPPGGVWNPPQRMVMVPYFKSQPVQTVAATLRRVGLSPGQEYPETSDLPAGTFTRTDPRGGTLVPRGSVVNIYESSGPPAPREVMIPYFRAIPETRVVSALEKIGLGVGGQIQEPSNLSAGLFTRTDPPGGTLVPLGRAVTVYYSSGPPQQRWVIIPAYPAEPEQQVVTALEGIGLKVSHTAPEKSDLQAGTFTRTVPAAGTRVAEGSNVVVRYSKGPPKIRLIVVPFINAEPEKDAVHTLQGVGLTIAGETSQQSNLAAGTFVRTEPAAGTRVPFGSPVAVFYSSGPPQRFVTIPAFDAQPEEQVVTALQALGLTVSNTLSEASDLQAGTFTRTDPPAGTRVTEGSDVVVRYSKGPPPVGATSGPVSSTGPTNNAGPPNNPGPTNNAPPQGNGQTYGGENPGAPNNPAGTPVRTVPPAGTRVPVGHAITVIHTPPRTAPTASAETWLKPILYFLAGGIVAVLALLAFWPGAAKLAAKAPPAAATPTVNVSLARGGTKFATPGQRGLILRCLLGPRDGPQITFRNTGRKP